MEAEAVFLSTELPLLVRNVASTAWF